MRTLLHLIDTTGPGGAETVFVNLVTAFDSRGDRSTSLVTEGGWVHRTLQAQGLPTYTANPRGSFNVGYLRAILDRIRHDQVDLIQAHLPGPNIYASLAGILTRTPVVSVFHGSVDLLDDSRFRSAKLQLVNHGSRCIVAVSHHLKAELVRSTRLDPRKMEVIHNGVDPTRFPRHRTGTLRKGLGIPDGAFVVGSVGNIRPAKGYDLLLHAAAALRDTDPSVHFVVAGDTSWRLFEDLMALRRDLALESRVHFIGFKPNAADVYAGIDLFLLPSTSEGFSISTIEAMASELPVVVTRSGGPEEIVEPGVDGLTVPPGDPSAIAAVVSRLAKDPDERRRLGAAAVRTVERRFSLETMMRRYGEIYERLTGNGAP